MVEAAAYIALLMFPLLMIVAGAGDVLSLRIPNLLCGAIGLLFLPFAVATGMPAWLIAVHLATCLAVLVIGYGLFSLGLIGGGDAKLMAAAVLWLGLPCALLFIMYTALAGGLLAAAIGLMFMLDLEAGQRSARLNRLFAGLRPGIPYGFAIAAGAILATSSSWWMRAAGA